MNKFVKNAWLLFLISMISFTSFAQDTVRVKEVVPFDTLLFEKVPVDTVIVTTRKSEKNAQDQKLKVSKIYYGGYVNLSFGSFTSVGVEPMLAYKLTPRLSTGTKLSYEYLRYKEGSYIYEESIYGLSLFSRLRVSPQFYAHAEFSTENYKFYDDFGESGRQWVPFLFLGGGYSVPVSENTWFTSEVLFDVLQNENSPYADWEPFFSVGFGVGF